MNSWTYWDELKSGTHRSIGKPEITKPDVPIHEPIDDILGHNVPNQEEKDYAEDYENEGQTLWGHNYEGPGNSVNRGDPTTRADAISQEHDIEYFNAKWMYDHGDIDENTYNEMVKIADSKFVKETSTLNTGDAVIGHDGIQIKRLAEKIFGRIYPQLSQEDREVHSHHYHHNKEYYDQHRPDHSKAFDRAYDEANAHSQFEASEERTHKSFVSEPGEVENMGTAENNNKVHISNTRNISGGNTANTSSGARKAAEGSSGQTATTPEQNQVENIDMAQLTGTGKEMASGGASSDGKMAYAIERPLSIFGTKISTYKKVHKFMTFGLADAIIGNGAAATGNKFLTSYLAEIPWHVPALYLNQSEFDLLPPGSRVVEVSIEAYYRGSTIQFETASTSSGLATLNQINDIGVAVGLNRTGWGSNVSFVSFDTTQPMIPTQINQPKYKPDVNGNIQYRGMVRDYYGDANNVPGFTDDIPHHQTGRHTFLYNYWCTTARDANTSTTPANQMFGGWPCLAEKIQQMDGKTVVNTCVVQSTYKPKMAPIKQPLKMRSHGLPFPTQNDNMSIPVGENLVSSRVAVVNHNNAVPSSSTGVPTRATEATTTYANNNSTLTPDPNFDLYTPIEKSQIARTGFWGEHKPHIQPSIHVGVQPVPSLTTAALLIGDEVFRSWTDTRAYWEVVATMKVQEHSPTAWPYATQANVPAGDVVMWIPANQRPPMYNNPSDDAATFAGLYPNEAAPITNTD